MKTALVTAAITAVLIFLLKGGIFNIKTAPTKTTQQVTIPVAVTQPSTPPPPPSASTIVEVKTTNPGWEFTHQGFGYWWYTPTTPVNRTTEWFNIKDLNTTYRVKTTCIVEFRDYDGVTCRKFKVVFPTGNSFQEIGNEIFSTTPIQEKEFLSIRMKTEAIRFSPLDGQGLIVKMGQTE